MKISHPRFDSEETGWVFRIKPGFPKILQLNGVLSTVGVWIADRPMRSDWSPNRVQSQTPVVISRSDRLLLQKRNLLNECCDRGFLLPGDEHFQASIQFCVTVFLFIRLKL